MSHFKAINIIMDLETAQEFNVFKGMPTYNVGKRQKNENKTTEKLKTETENNIKKYTLAV